MHALVNYVENITFNVIRRASNELFCNTFSFSSTSPSKIIASTGNITLILVKSNTKVDLTISCGKLKRKLKVSLDEDKIIYWNEDDNKKRIEKLNIYSFPSALTTIEEEMFKILTKISLECQLQSLCFSYKKRIKNVLVQGVRINVDDNTKHKLERIFTLMYKKSVKSDCNDNDLCIKNIILSNRKIFIQFYDN
ncbi:hypothetical protein DJ521_07120, partial [Sulfolobus sp. E3]